MKTLCTILSNKSFATVGSWYYTFFQVFSQKTWQIEIPSKDEKKLSTDKIFILQYHPWMEKSHPWIKVSFMEKNDGQLFHVIHE